MKRFLVLGFFTVGFAACGGDERPPAFSDSRGGGRGSVPLGAGTGGKETQPSGHGGTAGVEKPEEGGDGGAFEPEAPPPKLTITSPEAVSDPAALEAEVLVSGELEVICRAEIAEDAPSLREDSVTVELLDASGKVVDKQTAGRTGKAEEFSVVLQLSNEVPSGAVSLRCSANDSAKPPRTAEDVIETFFDGGPKITAVEPAEGSSKSARTGIPVSFVVEPVRLTEGDDAAAIEEVVLVVHGKEIPTTHSGDAYSATVHLNDTELFPMAPTDEVAVGIRAKNARGTESRHDYRFKVDSAGPTISIVTPAERAVIGSHVGPLVFKVTDDRAGVDRDSIAVFIDGEEHRYDGSAVWKVSGDTFSYYYDWAELGRQQSQVTVSVRAVDLTGNEAPGGSVVYYVDNVPPFISLDPPALREIRAAGPRYVSQPFDPVGSEAANDLSRVLTHVLVRAFVYDRTNETPGQTILYYAGTNPSSVRLYLHADPASGPFLTDLNGDGTCDDIYGVNDLAAFQELTALGAAGSPPGGPINITEEPLVSDTPYQQFSPANPEPLCNKTSDMTRILHRGGASGALVYALAPAAGLACAGNSWELDQNLAPKEGWVCLAAIVEDAVGNRDVSAPLRVCLSDGQGEEPTCDLASAPSCTDGCDPVEYLASSVPFAIRGFDASNNTSYFVEPL